MVFALAKIVLFTVTGYLLYFLVRDAVHLYVAPLGLLLVLQHPVAFPQKLEHFQHALLLSLGRLFLPHAWHRARL
jgi:hypothetical protein